MYMVKKMSLNDHQVKEILVENSAAKDIEDQHVKKRSMIVTKQFLKK